MALTDADLEQIVEYLQAKGFIGAPLELFTSTTNKTHVPSAESVGVSPLAELDVTLAGSPANVTVTTVQPPKMPKPVVFAASGWDELDALLVASRSDQAAFKYLRSNGFSHAYAIEVIDYRRSILDQ